MTTWVPHRRRGEALSSTRLPFPSCPVLSSPVQFHPEHGRSPSTLAVSPTPSRRRLQPPCSRAAVSPVSRPRLPRPSPRGGRCDRSLRLARPAAGLSIRRGHQKRRQPTAAVRPRGPRWYRPGSSEGRAASVTGEPGTRGDLPRGVDSSGRPSWTVTAEGRGGEGERAGDPPRSLTGRWRVESVIS